MVKDGRSRRPAAPGRHKAIRTAPTVAGLDNEDRIAPRHVAEAICARGIVAAAFWQRLDPAA